MGTRRDCALNILCLVAISMIAMSLNAVGGFRAEEAYTQTIRVDEKPTHEYTVEPREEVLPLPTARETVAPIGDDIESQETNVVPQEEISATELPHEAGNDNNETNTTDTVEPNEAIAVPNRNYTEQQLENSNKTGTQAISNETRTSTSTSETQPDNLEPQQGNSTTVETPKDADTTLNESTPTPTMIPPISDHINDQPYEPPPWMQKYLDRSQVDVKSHMLPKTTRWLQWYCS